MPKRYCPSNPPALTAEELGDNGDGNRLPDVRDLLWEIARLRQRVASAHYFIALVEAGQPRAQMMAHTCLTNFGAEPCVLEDIEGRLQRRHAWFPQMAWRDPNRRRAAAVQSDAPRCAFPNEHAYISPISIAIDLYLPYISSHG